MCNKILWLVAIPTEVIKYARFNLITRTICMYMYANFFSTRSLQLFGTELANVWFLHSTCRLLELASAIICTIATLQVCLVCHWTPLQCKEGRGCGLLLHSRIPATYLNSLTCGHNYQVKECLYPHTTSCRTDQWKQTRLPAIQCWTFFLRVWWLGVMECACCAQQHVTQRVQGQWPHDSKLTLISLQNRTRYPTGVQ